MSEVRTYKDKETGYRVAEVQDLSFLTDRNHPYSWLKRHYLHHRLRRAVKKAQKIIASDKTVAYDIHRFYFIPEERITIRPHSQNQE